MTAKEFIREKIREKNSFPEKYVMEGLQHYSVTGEDCLRWAKKHADQERKNERERIIEMLEKDIKENKSFSDLYNEGFEEAIELIKQLK